MSLSYTISSEIGVLCADTSLPLERRWGFLNAMWKARTKASGDTAHRCRTYAMHAARLDDGAKRTVVLKLHGHPYVQQLLLQRCGINPRWLDGKRARFLSRRMRQYGYSPASTRHAVEILGHDPDTYYMIGVEHRIPEPTPEARAKCVEDLLAAGFSPKAVETAMSVLGVPPGGRHPPKRKR